MCLRNLGAVERSLGNLRTAQSLYEQALALHEDHGSLHGQFATLDEFSLLYCEMNDYDRARHYSERAFGVVQQQSRPENILIAHKQLGWIDLSVDDIKAARRRFGLVVNGYPTVADTHEVFVDCTIGIAHLIAKDGNLHRAYRLAYLGLITPVPNKNSVAVERLVAELEAQLSADEIRRLRAEAEQLDLAEVVRELRAQFGEANQGLQQE